MRKIFFIFLIPSVALAQNEKSGFMPYENEKITYSRVINLDSSYSKYQIFSNALGWAKKITLDFNRSVDREQYRLRDNILIQDKDSGTILLEHRFVFEQMMAAALYSYTIEIKIKDGAYRYIITDFKTLAIVIVGMDEPATANTPLEPADLKRQKNRMREINNNIANLVSELENSIKRANKLF